ncbi:Vesicle transport protein SFT2B [Tritrichomonas musculus]|uniref:Vesicle transport protein n=1 Tax=Tritrichomonas musculus TaxID=1915356 RepID=A0ABR2L4S1_9EUKA
MSSTLFSDVKVGEHDSSNTHNSFYDEINDNYCNLSLKTRIIGAIICIVIGFVLNGIALGYLFTLRLKNFSIIYVFGTCASIGSSFFIVGPKKHFEAFKFKPHLIAAIILISCIILIFIFACGIKIGIIALIFVLIEMVDLIIFNLTLHEKIWEKVKSLFFKCIKCIRKDKNIEIDSNNINNNSVFQDI